MNAGASWRVALCAGSFAASVALSTQGPLVTAAVVAASSAAAFIAFAGWRTLTAVVAILACVAGTWRGVSAAAVDTGPHGIDAHLGSGAVVLRGTVGDAGVPGRDDTIVVDVRQLATESGVWTVSGAVVVEPRTPVAVLPGDTVDVEVTSLRAPPRRPGALSAVALERVGVSAIAAAAQVTVLSAGAPSPARLAEQLRQRLSATVTRMLPEPEATLLLGIAFGIHARLTAAVRAPLQDAGLIHVVAVSGLKVVMVAGLMGAAGRARGWSRRRRTVATLSVIGLYVVLSGSSAAALRSAVMVSAGLLLARDGRRPHSFALLGLCAAGMLMADPAVATDVGFQLSFLGTAGILVLAAPLAARLPGPRWLAEPFAVTVAAQLATAPVTAGTFGVLALVGPFANALALPLLPPAILLGGGGAICATVFPAAGWLPLEVGGLLSTVVFAIAQGMAALPFAAIPVALWPGQWTVAELAAMASGAAAWMLHARWRPRSREAILPVLGSAAVGGVFALVVTAGTATGVLRLTVLDVGNGVAVLIRPPQGGTVLVDGGADGAALLTALGRVLSPLDRHLDVVVLTATDHATAAAIPSLVGHYDVGTLLVSQPLPPALETVAGTLAGTGTRVIPAGASSWQLGGISGRCLPSGPAPGSACVLQVTDGTSSALVTGNLAQVAQDELAGIDTSRLHCDLLVGPTSTAPSAALLAAAQPRDIAVPALRTPPGLGASTAVVAVTGRDSDLEYDAIAGGGFADPAS